MKFLLTSAGITHATILGTLVELLGKPIADSSASAFSPRQPFPRRA